MAMAGTCLNIRPSSSSWIANSNSRKSTGVVTLKWFVLRWGSRPLLQQKHQQQLRYPQNRSGVLTALAVLEEEQVADLVAEEEEVGQYEYEVEEEEEKEYEYEDERPNDDFSGGRLNKQNPSRPCELYVCNLPRSSDIPDLMEMFKTHGTIFSVEISRSSETGISRGSGYVTMGSMDAAKAAIAALDGCDVGGREMRVRFSVHMNPRRRKNSEAMNSTPVKNMVYESPHKLYVGNLAWAVQPHVLRSHFSKFGTVASARVLHDRKSGKNRAYGFLSFSSAAERDAAVSLDGTEFCGRKIIVRGLLQRTYP